jgi:hypothetical protein
MKDSWETHQGLGRPIIFGGPTRSFEKRLFKCITTCRNAFHRHSTKKQGGGEGICLSCYMEDHGTWLDSMKLVGEVCQNGHPQRATSNTLR